MSVSVFAVYLSNAAESFATCSIYVNFSFGLIGNLLTILVLTQSRIFHHNCCAFYLVTESLVDIGQLSHLLANEIWKLPLNGIDPGTLSLVWCKAKMMLSQWYRLMLASIVCFVAIDQYLSTNPRPYLRQLSSLRIARFQIALAVGLSLLHAIPFGIFGYSVPSLGCIIANVRLLNYYSYAFYPLVNGLIPIFLSSFFSLLAYRNVRRIVRRQIPPSRRRLDQQLTAMIFVRVLSFVLLQLPFTIYQIYSLNLVLASMNTIEYAAQRWAQAVVRALLHLTHVTNFYIFLATSSRFRRQVKSILRRNCCCPHFNTIQPRDAGTLVSRSGPD